MVTESLAGHVLTLEEAEDILAPYRERLNRCIQHGWDVWKRDYQHRHHVLQGRARAAIVFDEIVACALEEFPTVPGVVKAVRTANTFFLYIGDSITIRFKKFRKNGRCSNIMTGQQRIFRAQQMSFSNMLDGTLVSAGYILDDLQQDIRRKSIICHLNKTVLWEMSLSTDNVAVVEFAPSTTVTPAAPVPPPRYTAKPELVPDKLINNVDGKN